MSENSKDIIRKVLDLHKEANKNQVQVVISKKPPPKVTKSSLKLQGRGKAETIAFGQLKKLRRNQPRDLLEEWTHRDVALYIRKKLLDKYNRNIEINIIGLTLYMGHIEATLNNVFGFCDMIVLRDYIDFYFEKWSDFFLKKSKGEFIPTTLKYNEPIQEFAKRYDYAKQMDAYLKRQKQSKVNAEQSAQKAVEFYAKDIEHAYLLGASRLLSRFGILMPMNWLILKAGYTEQDAMKYIANALSDMYQKHILQQAIDATENQNPYPQTLLYKTFDGLFMFLNKLTDNARESIASISLVFNEAGNLKWKVF
jgi:hypothetical protein